MRVNHDLNLGNLANLTEQIFELTLGNGTRQATDVKVIALVGSVRIIAAANRLAILLALQTQYQTYRPLSALSGALAGLLLLSLLGLLASSPRVSRRGELSLA